MNKFELFDTVMDIETKRLYMVVEYWSNSNLVNLMDLEDHVEECWRHEDAYHFVKVDPEITRLLYEQEFGKENVK